MNIILKNIIRFVVLILIQVTILNNIQVSGFVNPYMYILFILLLPFEIPNWLLLLLSFFLGFCIDVFCGTFGMHASACVFMGYIRPYILNYLSLRDGYEVGTFPGVAHFGFGWFFKYALSLIFAHHSFLFIIESFSFANFSETMMRIIFSTFFSLTLILTSQFLMFKK
ncbi:rod shape-determining protein MreD [Marinifilum sp.]|uniref:rod shape-determining protein MreD n=1 Tax=Marinifilum sp. TaxID=2033137 RepID=UPI003BACFA7F